MQGHLIQFVLNGFALSRPSAASSKEGHSMRKAARQQFCINILVQLMSLLYGNSYSYADSPAMDLKDSFLPSLLLT